jgi:hypothetical protein
MPATREYEIPRYGVAQGDRLLGWCMEAVQEGNAWLNAQAPTRDWEGVKQAMLPGTPDAGPADTSATGYNKVRRTTRELVASLANFRHDGEFKPAWDGTRAGQAQVLTKLDRSWYRKCRAHEEIRAGLQWAVGFGTTYWMQTWDPSYWGPGRGDIRLQAYGPSDVTFLQLPKSRDIQAAYGVLIREELPINLAKQIYGRGNPGFAASLVPDRNAPGWLEKGLRAVQKFVSPALRVAGRTGQGADAGTGFPTVDIYHLYTRDGSINEGIDPVTMGARGTNWSYDVPFLGQPLPVPGSLNPATGQPYTRAAEADDCMLFPLRRYTIFSSTGMCFDGASPWWHGQVPLVRLALGDWAWEALGTSLVADTRTMQTGVEAIMRGVEDSIAARLDPPMVFDENTVSDAFADKFNPRKGGARAKMNLMGVDKPIQFPVDPRYYDVPQWITQYIHDQEERMDYISGVKDLVAIAKARQLPSADTLEKLMEMAGPIVQDMVGQLASPFVDLANMRRAYYFQFYTRARMITVAGLTDVPVDEQFLPAHLLQSGQTDTSEIRRASLDEFYYDLSESGLNEIHRMSTKLLYLQLYKANFPLSPWTLADIMQIPNFGPPPESTKNEMERWVAWMHMQAELQGEAAAEGQIAAAGAMAQAGVPMPQPGGEGQPGAEGSDNTGKTGQSGAGRPSSFGAPPRMETKDGGTRSTIATSR